MKSIWIPPVGKLLALLFFVAGPVWAQHVDENASSQPSLSTMDGRTTAQSWVETATAPQAVIRGGNEVTLTHSIDQEIVNFTGVSCGNSIAGYTSPNSFWRVFDLGSLGFTDVFNISSVDVGVESVNGSDLPSEIRLHTLEGDFQLDNLTLLAEVDFTLEGGTALELINTPISTTVDQDQVLVVEWSVGDGQPTNTTYYPGANSAGQTGPSYILATDCQFNQPTDYASIGFADVHLVMNVHGSTPGDIVLPELAYSPDLLTFDVPGGGSATETLTLENLGTADLEFSFPGFTALARIADLRQQGIDLTPAGPQTTPDLPKGYQAPMTPRSQSRMAEYGVVGPDEFGYVAIDSDQPGGPTYDFIDISTTGTMIPDEDFDPEGCSFPGTDEGNATIELPFAFPFYGEAHSSIKVNINGVINVNGPEYVCTYFNNKRLPDPEIPNGGLIAPFWTDRDITDSDGAIYTQDLEDGRFVIQWDNVEAWGGGTPVTFQVILSESGTMLYQYSQMHDELNNSIGIENYDGTVGIQVSYNEDYAYEGLAVLITAAGAYISDVSPVSGTIAPGASESVQVTVNGSALAEGSYFDALLLNSNDLLASSVVIPASIEVGGGGGEPGDGGLTFNPDIEDGLDVTADAGTTTTGTVTITNPTDAAIEYTFGQYAERDGEMMPASPLSSANFPVFSSKEESHMYPSWLPSRGQGGPDEFGYTWTDSDEPGGPVFETIDISSTGTAQSLSTIPGCTITNVMDEGMAAVDLPFTFPFYGESHGQLWVSVNGLVSFEPFEDCNFSASPFPSSSAPSTGSPGSVIAPNWLDVVGNEGVSAIHTEHLSDGRFVIQWTDWPRWQETAPNTIQLILSPGGAIKFQYVEINTQAGILGGPQVGIQNHTFDDGLLVASDVSYLAAGKAVMISSSPTFVTAVSPASGSIPAGGSVDVTVTFDATEFIDGTYTGSLTIDTDEPSSYDYPVSLTVVGEAGCVIEPDPIAFGSVIVGFDSTLEATVTNSGTAACEIAEGSVDEFFALDFTPTTLVPGASMTFEVTFAPENVGAATGTLTFSSSGGDEVASAVLTGAGVAPPIASVNPESLHFDMRTDETATQSLTLSNLAGADAADLEYTVVVAAAHPGEGRVVMPEPVTSRGLSTGGTAARPGAGDASFGYHVPSSYTELPEGGITYSGIRGGVTITHSAALHIDAESGIGCANWEGGFSRDNQYFRVFDLSAFDLANDLTVESVDIGVWLGDTAALPTTTVRLYTLDGALVPANLTLVSETTMTLTAADHLSLATATFDDAPTFGLDETLVVEWSIPDGETTGYFVIAGFNGAGQTGPSYLQSPVCGANVPTDLADLGYPEYHWVLQVHGTTGPSVIEVDPMEGSVEPDGSTTLTVTANTEGLEPGTYEFDVMIATNDPSNPVLVVPVTVDVTVSTEDDSAPLTFDLKRNYPNPFAGQTTIAFEIPQAEHVLIEVIDLAGRRVAVLVDEQLEAARHEVQWNANGLASGVYLYRMRAGSFTKTLRTTVVR